MTFGTLRTSTLERLGEDTATLDGYYSSTDAGEALNWAQRLFVLLTLCLETTSSPYALTGGQVWYGLRATLTDWLLPLRVDVANTKVRPARLAELDALDALWQGRAGTPSRYACLGCEPVLFALYKQPAAPGTSLDITYARSPATMYVPSDAPEIPTEYQPLLIDAAIVYCRMKEGGQEFQKVEPLLRRFLDGAKQLGGYVRNRSLDLRYDSLPPELDRFDLSRLLLTERKKKPEWLITSDSRPAQAS